MDRERAPPLFEEKSGEEGVVRGVVERVIYESSQRGFSVILLKSEEGKSVTAVGNVMGAIEGDNLSMKGRWEMNRRYGLRFRITSFEVTLPKSPKGITRFLSSTRIEGIGGELAARIVKSFGEETLRVIDDHPERLLQVPGIGKKRFERIRGAWARYRERREMRVFLHNFGISPFIIEKIISAYGDETLKVVRENPYRVAEEVKGIGFLKADDMAGKMGIPEDAPIRARGVLSYILRKGAEDGHCFLPCDEVWNEAISFGPARETILKEMDGLSREGGLILDEIPEKGGGLLKVFYLPIFYHTEKGLSSKFVSLLKSTPPDVIEDLEGKISREEEMMGITLSGDQGMAVRAILREKVSILTGGPGTGKTTIVRVILRILEGEGFRVRLTAPTGRAARRLAEASLSPASTIHRLLEYSVREKRFIRNRDNPIEADLVVADESSMIDLFLMNSLVSALPEGCRLLLVGDSNQLPPVGPGRVFNDLIESSLVPVACLTEIHRQRSDSLTVVNAHRVNNGLLPFQRRRGGREKTDFYIIEREAVEDVLGVILTLLGGRIERAFPIHPISDVQVLTPIHRGILGSVNLNREIQKILNPDGKGFSLGGKEFRVNDRVLQTKNNYDLEVFNGDTGRIVSFREKEGVMVVDFYGREVEMGAEEALDIEPGYAISIHKAQGSEYPGVIIPVVFHHYIMLRRNLIYTAITRGKDLVVLVGQMRALAKAINNDIDEKRYTALKHRLLKHLKS